MSRHGSQRSAWVIALACTVVLAIAGCGGGSSTTSTTSTSAGAGGSTSPAPASGKTTTLNVGIVGAVIDAPMYLGMQKGFFAEQGLKIVPKVLGGGAAVIPGVVSGELQVGSSNPVSLIIAGAKGLPLEVIAGQNHAATKASDKAHVIAGILVAKDSPIKSPEDLAGKTIAVNTLANIGGVTVKGSLRNLGVPVDGIKLVEIGFPDMLSALKSGRIDAAQEIEPFVTLGKQQGDRVIVPNFVGTAPKLPLTEYFVSKSYAQSNPDQVEGFRKGIDKSLRYASAHPDEVRKVVPTFTKIPAAAAKAIALPVFTSEVSPARVEQLAKLMRQDGLIKEMPDLDALFGPAYNQ